LRSVRASVPGDPFEALGDTNRREILRLLSDGGKPVQEIADAMSISRPAVSRHLRLLKDAGMVAEEAQGTRRIYHLQQEGMQAVRVYLESVWGDAATRFRLFAENTDDSAPRARSVGQGTLSGGRRWCRTSGPLLKKEDAAGHIELHDLQRREDRPADPGVPSRFDDA
jgi:DNA-binding transcriptional ArsR family regulator